jgi:hypothetical protein
MRRVGFEPMNLVFERANTFHALDSAIGLKVVYKIQNVPWLAEKGQCQETV